MYIVTTGISQDCPVPAWGSKELKWGKSLNSWFRSPRVGILALVLNCCVTLPKLPHHSESCSSFFPGFVLGSRWDNTWKNAWHRAANSQSSLCHHLTCLILKVMKWKLAEKEGFPQGLPLLGTKACPSPPPCFPYLPCPSCQGCALEHEDTELPPRKLPGPRLGTESQEWEGGASFLHAVPPGGEVRIPYPGCPQGWWCWGAGGSVDSCLTQF